MMSNTMGDDNWGERNLRRRNRQIWATKAVMVGLGVAFLLGMLLLPSPGAVIRGSMAAGYVAVIAALGWVQWRRTDEIQRRIAINAFAVMGLTCLMLMPLAGGVGPLIGLREPLLVVFIVAFLTVPVAVVFQRMRG